MRMGEMEKDVMCSHGIMITLFNKFHFDSDGFEFYICKSCGTVANVCIEKNYAKCNNCESNAEIVKINTSWMTNQFIHKIQSLNIGVNLLGRPKRIFIKDEEQKENVIEDKDLDIEMLL